MIKKNQALKDKPKTVFVFLTIIPPYPSPAIGLEAVISYSPWTSDCQLAIMFSWYSSYS